MSMAQFAISSIKWNRSLGNHSGGDGDVDFNPGAFTPVYGVITAVILILSAILSSIGNGIIIAVVIHKKSLRTVTHTLVTNLSIAHLLTSTVCVPVEAVSLLYGGMWTTGLISCKIINFLHCVFTSASILALSTIAIDRYYSVVYPLEKKMTMFKGKFMIFYVWLQSTVVCLPMLFVFRIDRKFCISMWNYITQGQVYFVCYTVLTVFGPLVLSCLAYCFVWRAFRLSQRRVHTTKSMKSKRNPNGAPFYTRQTELKLLKMLFLMVFCYITFRGPYIVYLYRHYFTKQETTEASQNFMLTAFWVANMVCVFDPIIYGYLNKHFRKALYETCVRCPTNCANAFNMDVTITTADMYPYYQNSDYPAPSTYTPSPSPYIVPKIPDTGAEVNQAVEPIREREENVKLSVTKQTVNRHTTSNVNTLRVPSMLIPPVRERVVIGTEHVSPARKPENHRRKEGGDSLTGLPNDIAQISCDPARRNTIVLAPLDLKSLKACINMDSQNSWSKNSTVRPCDHEFTNPDCTPLPGSFLPRITVAIEEDPHRVPLDPTMYPQFTCNCHKHCQSAEPRVTKVIQDEPIAHAQTFDYVTDQKPIKPVKRKKKKRLTDRFKKKISAQNGNDCQSENPADISV